MLSLPRPLSRFFGRAFTIIALSVAVAAVAPPRAAEGGGAGLSLNLTFQVPIFGRPLPGSHSDAFWDTPRPRTPLEAPQERIWGSPSPRLLPDIRNVDVAMRVQWIGDSSVATSDASLAELLSLSRQVDRPLQWVAVQVDTRRVDLRPQPLYVFPFLPERLQIRMEREVREPVSVIGGGRASGPERIPVGAERWYLIGYELSSAATASARELQVTYRILRSDVEAIRTEPEYVLAHAEYVPDALPHTAMALPKGGKTRGKLSISGR